MKVADSENLPYHMLHLEYKQIITVIHAALQRDTGVFSELTMM